MVDRRRHAGFPQEAAADRVVLRQRRSDDLQGDDAVERELARAIDDAHPAATCHRFDPVPGEHAARRHVAHGCGVYRPRGIEEHFTSLNGRRARWLRGSYKRGGERGTRESNPDLRFWRPPSSPLDQSPTVRTARDLEPDGRAPRPTRRPGRADALDAGCTPVRARLLKTCRPPRRSAVAGAVADPLDASPRNISVSHRGPSRCWRVVGPSAERLLEGRVGGVAEQPEARLLDLGVLLASPRGWRRWPRGRRPRPGSRRRRSRSRGRRRARSRARRRARSRGGSRRPAARARRASPPCQTGPTTWMTCCTGRRPAPVIFASPVSQPPSVRHSSSSSGPGGAVDRAVDASAAEQARVGGVDDRVRFGVRGDVAAMQGNQRHVNGTSHAGGGTRTPTACGHEDLNLARLPVPPRPLAPSGACPAPRL